MWRFGLITLAGCSMWGGAEERPLPTPNAPNSMARAPQGNPDFTVDCMGGGDYASIQSAIDDVPSNSWIQVLPCTYNETIDYRGKNLWISSRDGAPTTLLNAQNASTAVTATQAEGSHTALVGFTVKNANAQAALVTYAHMLFKDVNFIDNDGSYVIYSEGADIKLDNVVIDTSNEESRFTVYMDKGSLQMTRSSIACDSGDLLFLGHGSFLIDWSTLTCQGNDLAVEVEHAEGRIQRSVVDGKIEVVTEDDHLDDIITLDNSYFNDDIEVSFGTFRIRNSIGNNVHLTFNDVGDAIVIENSVFVDGDCVIDGTDPEVIVRNNVFYGVNSHCGPTDAVGQDGNIDSAPGFVDPAAGDFHLGAGSPLINAGATGNFYNDVDGSQNDIGIYGGRFTQDGGW